jgi:NitT/TauT family transport system substrate-binding protein
MMRLLLCVVGILCALASVRAAEAQTLTPIAIATIGNDSAAEVLYAKDLGFFKDAGFDPQISILNNAAAATAAVTSGSVQVALTTVSTLASAHEKGLPYVIIAPAALYVSSNGIPTTAIIVAKNSALRSAKDLNGKTIGVNGLKNVTQIATQAWVDQNGGDSKTLKFVEIPDSLDAPAILDGRIDAAFVAQPSLDHALSGGELRVLGPAYDGVAKQFMTSVWITVADYAKANPTIVRRFAAVMIKTAHWANNNHARSAEILEKYTKIEISPTMSRITYPERLTPALVQPLIDVSAKYGLLKEAFPAKDLFAPGIE